MSMFSDSEWTQAEDTHLAPGPAAFSRNGNGAEESQAADFAERVSGLTTLEWIAVAPPAAVVIIAASGAILFAVFSAIFAAMGKANVNG